MDGMPRTVAHGDRRRKAENQHFHLRVFERSAVGGAGAPASVALTGRGRDQ
jgi:hypothetical protein